MRTAGAWQPRGALRPGTRLGGSVEECFKSLFFAVSIVLLLGVLSRPLRLHGLVAPFLALLGVSRLMIS